MKFINQRQSPRIDIRLRCQVSSPGFCHRSSMITENISRTGILVVWHAAAAAALRVPEVGQLVTVEIELPAHHGFGRKCIHCQAAVVRVWLPENDHPRVGLSVNYMKFGAYRDKITPLQRVEPAGAGTWLS